jgi:predicted TIM-barrel fold metal-dependent hydrolase
MSPYDGARSKGGTMTTERLISADSHVRVPIEAIRERVPTKLHEAFDGALGAHAKHEAELKGGKELDISVFVSAAFAEPGYWDPVERLKAMDRDGVAAEVLYSEVSAFRHFGLIKDDWKPISRAFTDHLSEFAAHDPKRLVVSYQVPLLDIDYAVSEVLRLADLGARAVQLPSYPAEIGLPDYYDECYEPFWAVLQETGMSISHHLGIKEDLYDVFRRDPTPQNGIFTSLPMFMLAETIGFWILPGVLERFPGLKIVFVESQLAWVPAYLDLLDYEADGRYDFPGLTMKPSDYFRRNMACTFLDDERGLAMRHELGVENIMWSTDFPHPATTWPNSREVVERQFADIPADERELIVSGNAARVYGL